MLHRLAYKWRLFWVRFNGPRGMGRLAARLATWKTAPYHARAGLAKLVPRGFVAPTAYMDYPDLTLGQHVYVGDRVVLTVGDATPGPVSIGDHAQLYGDTFMQTGTAGGIRIGAHTHIQPGCHLRAFVSDIVIGDKVEIAAGCSFYSFNHGVDAGRPIMDQGLTSKGDIVIGDGAWLGHGVTVLDGATIGKGAVIGAGSVVVKSIPDNAIAVGSPARVIRQR